MGSRSIAAMAAAFAMLGTGSALAQTGWYAGASLGESRTSDQLVSNRESTVVNATVTGSTFDAKDTAVRIFGGYRFSPWLSLEANYADLGKTRLQTGTLAGDPPLPGTYTQNRSVTGYGADLVVSAPVWERASVFARLGAQRAQTKSDATLEGNIVFTNGNPSDRHRSVTFDETVAAYGAGAEWMFNPQLGVRLEWERWSKVGKPFAVGGSGTTGEADMDFYLAGLFYRF